jgi:hypothetical protein
MFFCNLNEAGQGTCFGRIVCELSDNEPFLSKCSLERLHIVHRVAYASMYRNHTDAGEVRVSVKERERVCVCVCVCVCVWVGVRVKQRCERQTHKYIHKNSSSVTH